MNTDNWTEDDWDDYEGEIEDAEDQADEILGQGDYEGCDEEDDE